MALVCGALYGPDLVRGLASRPSSGLWGQRSLILPHYTLEADRPH